MKTKLSRVPGASPALQSQLYCTFIWKKVVPGDPGETLALLVLIFRGLERLKKDQCIKSNMAILPCLTIVLSLTDQIGLGAKQGL